MTAHDPRYPIGPFSPPETITPEDRLYAIQAIAEMPEQLREAVRDLDTEQMNTPYREGGWTVRQVVHHLADSHMTAFHRLRRALTEDWPEVHGYNEKAFAVLPDVARAGGVVPVPGRVRPCALGDVAAVPDRGAVASWLSALWSAAPWHLISLRCSTPGTRGTTLRTSPICERRSDGELERASRWRPPKPLGVASPSCESCARTLWMQRTSWHECSSR